MDNWLVSSDCVINTVPAGSPVELELSSTDVPASCSAHWPH